jgi:hypothetical protein
MNYGGARGGGKSPVSMCFSVVNSINAFEKKRKQYRKARWKRKHSRHLSRVCKRLGVL